MTLSYFLVGGIIFGVLLARPQLALFFFPILFAYPRTIPRLFGRIGIMEAFLPLAGMVWAINVAVHHRQIRVNWFLGLALLAAVPIVSSAVIGRGDQDTARALVWLTGCGTYLLALNLGHDRNTAEKILLWLALGVVGITGLDYLTHGWLPRLQDISDILSPQLAYRDTAFGVGYNNSVAVFLAAVMPVLTAYTLLSPDRSQQRTALVGAILGMLLGLLTLSRAFWVGTGIGVIAQVYAIWKLRRSRTLVSGLLLVGGSVGLISLIMPTMAKVMKRRFESPLGSRIELSVIQIKWASKSLLLGHGSHEATSRFAHAMIPTALYDYGLLFTLPLLGVLGLWLRQVLRQVNQTDPDGEAYSVAHLGVMVGIAGIMIFNDSLITNTGYVCLAFLIAGLLGQRYQVKSRPTNYCLFVMIVKQK